MTWNQYAQVIQILIILVFSSILREFVKQLKLNTPKNEEILFASFVIFIISIAIAVNMVAVILN